MSRRSPALMLRVCLLQWAAQRVIDWPESTVRLALWFAVDAIDRDPKHIANLLALFTPDERDAVGADASRAIGRVLELARAA